MCVLSQVERERESEMERRQREVMLAERESILAMLLGKISGTSDEAAVTEHAPARNVSPDMLAAAREQKLTELMVELLAAEKAREQSRHMEAKTAQMLADARHRDSQALKEDLDEELARALAGKERLVEENEKMQCGLVELQDQAAVLKQHVQELTVARAAAEGEVATVRIALETRESEVKTLRAAQDLLHLTHAQQLDLLQQQLSLVQQQAWSAGEQVTAAAKLAEEREQEVMAMRAQVAVLVAADARAQQVKALNDKLMASLQRMEER